MLGGVGELQLGLLALGDVGEDALEAGLSGLVDDPASLVAHPHDVAVGVQEAVLVVEQAVFLASPSSLMTRSRSSGWMRCSHSSGIGHPLLGRVAEHRLDLRAHVEAAPGGSPPPSGTRRPARPRAAHGSAVRGGARRRCHPWGRGARPERRACLPYRQRRARLFRGGPILPGCGGGSSILCACGARDRCAAHRRRRRARSTACRTRRSQSASPRGSSCIRRSATRRRAPTSCSRSARTLVRRDGSLARAAPLAPAVLPGGQQLRRRAAVRLGAAPRMRAGREPAVPRARGRAAPDLRARRAPPPAEGQPSGLARAAGLAHALPRTRGRRAVLALLARRRLALHAARRHAARRAQGQLPGIHQHHEGDWEAVTVGLSADRPLFVDWSAHCAGEWRPFAGATLVADPGGERTHPGLVDRARIARQPGGRGDRATALVALRPARGDVRAPARRRPHRARRDRRDRRAPRRRARHPRPRGQRRAAGVPARARQPPAPGR